MKKWKNISSVLSFFLILYIPYIVHGAELDTIIDSVSGLTAPHGYQADIVAKQVLSGENSTSFSGVLSFLKDLLLGSLKENLPLILKMAACGMLSGILVQMPEKNTITGRFLCALLIARIALENFAVSARITEEVTDSLFLFIQGLFPAVVASAATSGNVAGTGTVSAVFVSMQVFMQVLRRFMMPLISIICVLAVGDSLGEQSYLSGIVSFLRQGFRWCTGLLLLLYGGVITLATGASSVFDKLIGKTVKYAVGSMVPVIGGALADSIETVMAGAKAIRGALGVSGIIGVCSVAVSPVVSLCAYALCFKIAAMFVSVCGDTKTVRLIQEIGGGIFRMCAVTVASAVMFIISISMLCFMGGAV